MNINDDLFDIIDLGTSLSGFSAISVYCNAYRENSLAKFFERMLGPESKTLTGHLKHGSEAIKTSLWKRLCRSFDDQTNQWEEGFVKSVDKQVRLYKKENLNILVEKKRLTKEEAENCEALVRKFFISCQELG